MGYFDTLINNMGPDRDYRPRGYFAEIQDITEQRVAELELEAQQEKLRQSEKLEAVGSMAGGIAHDFNNILTPILGYAEWTQRLLGEEHKAFKYMASIIKASHRAKDLISQILTFCRKSDDSAQNFKPTLVTPIVKEVLAMQRKAIPETIEINRILKAKNDTILGDPTKIHQIFMNLTTNAWHAMRDNPKSGMMIEVATSEFSLERHSKEFPDLAPGRYLRVSVRDTGCGMPPHIQKRIWEPFFTTKKKGEGTGLGLAMVRSVMTQFKGGIYLESTVGVGTTFHLAFPIVEQQAEEAQASGPAELKTGSERILLVDNDEEILEMVAHMLAAVGYKPTAVGSPIEALAMFKSSPYQFDVVITDQQMNGMLGSDMAEAMFAIRADLPLIFVTGYSGDFTAEQAKTMGARAFLSKPIDISELTLNIRSALDTQPGQLIRNPAGAAATPPPAAT